MFNTWLYKKNMVEWQPGVFDVGYLGENTRFFDYDVDFHVAYGRQRNYAGTKLICIRQKLFEIDWKLSILQYLFYVDLFY